MHMCMLIPNYLFLDTPILHPYWLNCTSHIVPLYTQYIHSIQHRHKMLGFILPSVMVKSHKYEYAHKYPYT
jgi:hypothetical protein